MSHANNHGASPSLLLTRSLARARVCVCAGVVVCAFRCMRIFVFVRVVVLLLLGIQYPYCMLLAGIREIAATAGTSASTAANVFSVDQFSMSANFYSVGGSLCVAPYDTK